MCKHKNCEAVNIFNHYPEELPIDSNGYCLFHSNNDDWQIQNDFENAFLNLIQNTAKLNKDTNISQWKYFFEGFNFPSKLGININGLTFITELKFSKCYFKSRIAFKNCNIKAFTIENSVLENDIVFTETTIRYGICSESVEYKGSFKILESNLKGSSFFKENVFAASTRTTGFLIKKCDIIEYVSFENTSFNISTAITQSILNKEMKFTSCEIANEFIFEDNVINDSLVFNKTYFTLTENLNPMYSSAHFENITITEQGKIFFKGNKKEDDVVSNELSMSFKTPPLGLIIFENFNLNKIFHITKDRLLVLEKEGKVEIGKGCRKYCCQTDIFTIKASNAGQELILSLSKIFCNYFELSENKNLGIEIVERTKSIIRYFYFTDENITTQEFLDRLNLNESNLWLTFSNLTAYTKSSIENLEIQLLLDDISSFFSKLGTVAKHELYMKEELVKVLSSIAVQYDVMNKAITLGQTLLPMENLIENLIKFSTELTKLNPLYPYKGLIEINVTNYYSENITVDKFINNDLLFDTNTQESIKEIVRKELTEISNELDEQQKTSKIKKFIKEWGPTITEFGMKVINNWPSS